MFGLADLAASDSVEVKAYVDDAGNLVAAKLERHETDPEAIVTGLAGAVSGTEVTVLGLVVDTTPLFPGDTAARDAFLASLEVGTSMVALTGTIAGTVVTWDGIALD